jgi:broad specificity phosphatase PhoE
MELRRRSTRNGLERAALVTHAGVMKVIVGQAHGLPEKKWMRLAFDYESVRIR